MTTITTEKPQIAEIPTGVEIDPVTLDIIEGALKSARYEMDAVLFRSAMSPVIREQHDEFPMITDPRGRMVVGQFGAYINEMMEDWDRGIYPGDVILTSDPFKCSASISHTNDWLVLVPIFYDDELVGWSSQFGHQMDAGGPLPGSLPTGARTIFEGHPAENLPIGNRETLARSDRAVLSKFRDTYFVANNMVVAVVGHFNSGASIPASSGTGPTCTRR